MAKVLPGKGLHVALTEGSLFSIQDALEEIGQYYTDDTHDNSPEVVLDTISKVPGWSRVRDKFGDKVYKSRSWNDGEIRVTVVLKDGELKLDIRYWYPAER